MNINAIVTNACNSNKKILLAIVILPLIVVVIGYYFISDVKTEPIHIDNTTETESSESFINVDIQGAVKTPGVYKLKSESRVTELLSLAGGLSDSVNFQKVSKELNLAAKLEDSDKIYIPFDWEDDIIIKDLKVSTYPLPKENVAATGDSQNVSVDTHSGKININTAANSDIDSLPGIGPVYLQKILTNRPYKTFEDLTAKSGIPVTTLNKLKDLISF